MWVCRKASCRPGFSLVELLVVVGIIALLISILIPALSRPREQAQKVKVASLLSSIEKGLEMFRNDFGYYPDSSRRVDAISDLAPAGKTLSGAHWLARAMVGHDLKGVDVRAAMLGMPDSVDQATLNTAGRKSLYVDGEIFARDDNTEIFLGTNSSVAPAQRIVIYEPSFRSPVLYYRARPMAPVPFTSCSSPTCTAIYSIVDNQDITGNEGTGTQGWDFSGQAVSRVPAGINSLHRLGIPGVTSTTPMDLAPDPNKLGSFARSLYSESAYKAVGPPLKPMRADSFVLITAGPDGILGTTDDVTNFKKAF